MRKQLPELVSAFKKGFFLGALASLFIYGCVRILFAGFDFSIAEEIINIIRIISIGGLILGLALISFLLLELLITESGKAQIFSFTFGEKKVSQAAA